MKRFTYILVIGYLLSQMTACDKEYLDPHSVLDPTVQTNVESQILLLNGMQKRWSTERSGAIYTTVTASGLTTGELRLLNPGNIGENDLFIGGNTISGDNEVLKNMWNQLMLLRKEATTIIDNADKATSDVQEQNTLKAHALVFRAMVHGTLIQYFEQIPITIGANAPFENRSNVLAHAITDLTTAIGYADNGMSASIESRLLKSFKLQNVAYALIARYQLMAGNNEQARVAADKVSLTEKSVWVYETAYPNPMAFWFSSNNVAQAKDKMFGLPTTLSPNANDQRIDFYVSGTEPNYLAKGFYQEYTSEIPIYLPGEMLLIKAEAYAREDKLTEAVTELNKVLVKTPSDDSLGVGAGLTAYTGAVEKQAILDEIYKNRRIELYLSGLSLEDSRRFNRPMSERNRNFFPYPNSERDNNSNTPSNPAN
ncbi:MAG: RagB/SusD family nutrient uptake outer membrane protein [Capnocytophaga sp.]|nr:RagB/SusD family nutrient uptake outer membrane protein [Capnocytophaga sp.]